MQRIVTSKVMLSMVSKPCGDDWQETVDDLLQTARHHAAHNPMGCAGLAANQIGVLKRCFVMKWGAEFMAVVDPAIVSMDGGMKAGFEGCLSLPGMRPVKVRRHKRIKVTFLDPTTRTVVTRKFAGFDARVFQHEFDHLNGVLI